MATTQKQRMILALLLVLLAGVVWLISRLAPRESYTPKRAREDVLRQGLKILRDQIDNYTIDKQEAPRSLDDLVVSGYIRRIPIDPMTGRKDTWVLQWSSDPKKLGIVNIHSGSQSISSRGTPYAEW